MVENISENDRKMYLDLFNHVMNGVAYCKIHFDNQGKPDDFTYLAVNDAFEKLTGLKDVVGKKVSEVIPGIQEDEPELFKIYGRVSKGGQPELFETLIESLGIWFLVSVYSPEPEYFIAIFNVSNERKDKEIERLKKENEELKKKCEDVK